MRNVRSSKIEAAFKYVSVLNKIRTGWPLNMGCFFMFSINDSTYAGSSNVQQLRLRSMLWDGLVAIVVDMTVAVVAVNILAGIDG